jgi:hypothetical protein
MKGSCRVFALIGILIVQASVVMAADNGIDEGGVFETSVRYLPAADADGLQGEVAITEAEAQTRYTVKAGGVLPVTFGLSNGYVGIDNSSPLELPSRLVALKTDVETTVPFLSFDKTYLRVGVSPSFFGDSWSFETSDFRILSRAVLIRKPNEQWVYIAGVAWYPDYETEVFPVFGFRYIPSERLTVNITPRSPNVSYKLDDRWTLALEAGSSAAEYEVKKGDYQTAVLQYRNVRAGAALSCAISRNMTAVFACGGVFNRRFQYRDSLGKVNLENGMYVEARVGASF